MPYKWAHLSGRHLRWPRASVVVELGAATNSPARTPAATASSSASTRLCRASSIKEFDKGGAGASWLTWVSMCLTESSSTPLSGGETSDGTTCLRNLSDSIRGSEAPRQAAYACDTASREEAHTSEET